MPTPALTLRAVNALDREAFVAALGGLFEGPAWIVAEAWQARPFADLTALHRALCAVLDAAPEERKLALLRAHPDLVGRAARAGALGAASTAEQAAAGLDRLTPDEVATFDRLNRAYQERYGFPFVICARENQKESILAGFASRMGHTRAEEVAIALGEVAKICRLRLLDTVREDGEPT
jgi:OHCU decarboxylase